MASAALPEEFDRNPPAKMIEIERAEEALDVRLPDEYRDLLLRASGGEGPLGR